MNTTELSKLLGWQILQELLSIANKNGKFSIDKSTYMPKENKIWKNNYGVRRLRAMMDVCGITPCQEVDKKGYDFLQNFVSSSFSENRKEKILKVFESLHEFDKDDEQSISEGLSTMEGRFEIFKYYFFNRKKINNLHIGEPNVRNVENWKIPIFCKFAKDYLIIEKTGPICDQLDEILVLLMGDYADKEFKMCELHYDCPF